MTRSTRRVPSSPAIAKRREAVQRVRVLARLSSLSLFGLYRLRILFAFPLAILTCLSGAMTLIVSYTFIVEGQSS
jgi:hypothetical protein